MITHKIQISDDVHAQKGLEYVQFESTDPVALEKAMIECAKYIPTTHQLAPLPIWEYLCDRYHSKITIGFSFTFAGVIYKLTYWIHKYMFKRLTLDKYLEIYGVHKND